MGEVWRAKHRLLARPAAIKLIRPSLAGKAAGHDPDHLLRRFKREAQVTAELRSPHTVELWDFGVADDGGFYYVMELLDGLDLEALVRLHGPVPPSARSISSARCVTRSRKPKSTVSSTATSSRPTFSRADMGEMPTS